VKEETKRRKRMIQKVAKKNAYLIIDELGMIMIDVVVAKNQEEAMDIFFRHRTYLNEEYRDTKELQESRNDYAVVNLDVIEVLQ
jgi:phage regulator Rha-like protein